MKKKKILSMLLATVMVAGSKLVSYGRYLENRRCIQEN